MSPEGWVVTGATVLVGLIASRALKRHPFQQFAVVLLTTAALVVVSMATGTRPGSRLFGDTIESSKLEAPSD